jgi:hypothetical protein
MLDPGIFVVDGRRRGLRSGAAQHHRSAEDMTEPTPARTEAAITLESGCPVSLSSEDQNHTNYKTHRAIYRPFSLAGHEASGNDVDSLKKPYAACDDEQNPYDRERYSHFLLFER